MVASLLPHTVQRARCRSTSLDASRPQRMTATAHASGVMLAPLAVQPQPRRRATRRIGEMIAAQPKAPPGRKPDIGLSKNSISERNINRPIELTEAGIDKNLAHAARQLAEMSEEDHASAWATSVFDARRPSDPCDRVNYPPFCRR